VTTSFASFDDADLVARLQSGSPEAFETLVQTYGGTLLRTARRLLRSEEDARDALQDAFVSVFQSIGGFESHAKLSTWLHRIVVNRALMKLRSQRRHPEEDLEQYLPRFLEDGHAAEPAAPWAEGADVLIEREEVRSLVRQNIDRLPETFRTVLLLRDLEELSTEETAGALGISANAVKIRLHRARQALRTLLDPHLRVPAGAESR
jgi:RNA polymerase sigma factor, sigma-70 family